MTFAIKSVISLLKFTTSFPIRSDATPFLILHGDERARHLRRDFYFATHWLDTANADEFSDAIRRRVRFGG